MLRVLVVLAFYDAAEGKDKKKRNLRLSNLDGSGRKKYLLSVIQSAVVMPCKSVELAIVPGADFVENSGV